MHQNVERVHVFVLVCARHDGHVSVCVRVFDQVWCACECLYVHADVSESGWA